jgi:pimeloyl-ACP methyl ester carboxylesterase
MLITLAVSVTPVVAPNVTFYGPMGGSIKRREGPLSISQTFRGSPTVSIRFSTNKRPNRLMPTNCDWRKEYPFRSQMFDLGGVRMHYVDEGPRESPDETGAVLCVHGNPTWSFYYRKLVAGLSPSHRVIAVDHVGMGLSDKPQRYDYHLGQHVANLTALINGLDLEDITLVVHDWGGPIGALAALDVPDRLRRLVILNTGLFPPPYVPLRIRACRTPLFGGWAMQRFNAFAGPAVWMAVSGRRGPLSPAARAGLLAPYHTSASRLAIRRFVEDIPLTPRHRTWKLLEDLETGLEVFADRPTQIVWGMRDWCFRPECLERIADRLPQSRISRIEDAGHYLLEDAGDEVLAVVREFLGESDSARGDSSGEASP